MRLPNLWLMPPAWGVLANTAVARSISRHRTQNPRHDSKVSRNVTVSTMVSPRASEDFGADSAETFQLPSWWIGGPVSLFDSRTRASNPKPNQSKRPVRGNLMIRGSYWMITLAYCATETIAMVAGKKSH